MQENIQDIWDQFHEELRGFILKKVKDETVANDILQNVFVKIIEKSKKISQARNMQQYIYAMARNATYDYFRNRKIPEKLEEIEIEFTDKEDNTLNRTIAECCIKPFVKQLPGKYREALLKTEFEGLPQKELAKELGLSYSGAKSRVQRGREKLRELILDCCALQSDAYGNLQGDEVNDCDC